MLPYGAKLVFHFKAKTVVQHPPAPPQAQRVEYSTRVRKTCFFRRVRRWAVFQLSSVARFRSSSSRRRTWWQPSISITSTPSAKRRSNLSLLRTARRRTRGHFCVVERLGHWARLCSPEYSSSSFFVVFIFVIIHYVPLQRARNFRSTVPFK